MNRWNGPVFCAIDMFIVLFVMALVLMAPPEVVKILGSDKPICQMAVDITWDSDNTSDVDLWVKAPGDRPVGYSAKNAKVFDLVRDDLGWINDSGTSNSERACARNLPEGEYIINAHLYSRHESPLPLSIVVVVSLVNPSSAFMEQIVTKQFRFEHEGEELTVVRFSIKDGKLVSGSENALPIGLRNASGAPRSLL